MTLEEIGREYLETAKKIKMQLKELRAKLKTCEDEKERDILKYRISVLTPALTDCNQTAERCLCYYGNATRSGGQINVQRKSDGPGRGKRSDRGAGVSERKAACTDSIYNGQRTDPPTERNCDNGSAKEQNDFSDRRRAKYMSQLGF